MPKVTAGKWGPIAFAMAQVDCSELETALNEVKARQTHVWHVKGAKYDQYRAALEIDAAQSERLRLLAEYDVLSREYWVLGAWADMLRAAEEFARNGCRSPYLPDVVEVELVELPDPADTRGYWSATNN